MGKLGGSEKGKDSLNSPPPLRSALHSLGVGAGTEPRISTQTDKAKPLQRLPV